MTHFTHTQLDCPNCGTITEMDVYQSVNLAGDPDLRDKLMKNQINQFECASCHEKVLVSAPLLVHDLQNRWWFQLADSEMNPEEHDTNADLYFARLMKISGEREGASIVHSSSHRFRLVYSMDELVELVGLSEDGHDDVSILMMKYFILYRQVPCPECGSREAEVFYFPRRWVPADRPDSQKVLRFVAYCTGCQHVRQWEVDEDEFQRYQEGFRSLVEKFFPDRRDHLLSSGKLKALAHQCVDTWREKTGGD